MESANFHHHQHQDHELVDSSPFLSWSQKYILTGTNNGISSRNLCLDTGANSMVQDLGFSWSSGTNNMNGLGYPMENFMNHDLQRLARIKDEFSVAESYPKFLELLNCSPTSSIKNLHFQPYHSSYMKNDQDFLNTNFTNIGRDQIKGGQIIIDQNSCNGAFSQIFPTISISSLNQSSSSPSSSSTISSSSFDMNCLPPLDLFGSPRFNGSFSDPTSLNAHNLGGLPYGLHQQNHKPLVCSGKTSSVISTTRSTDQSSKRLASKCIEAKASAQAVATKKSKSEQRFSCAPFQVRKEKLGDRIAAIQQLVAPFGKTDTASVLMEAIGYIKFLQTQVETLSVPYMKSSDKIDGISTHGGQMEDGNKGVKRDLRSRGLCLVPLSCLSYVTDGSEGIWPTP